MVSEGGARAAIAVAKGASGMVSRVLRSALRGGALALLMAGAANALEAGQSAPPVTLFGGSAGQAVQVPAAGGKLSYIDFWASWCGTCRQSFPWMNQLQRTYGPQGLQVIGVNLDAEAEDAAGFLAKVPAEFTIAYDATGDSARQYGVKGMPTSLLVGADGKVILVHTGYDAEGSAAIEAAIRRALGVAP